MMKSSKAEFLMCCSLKSEINSAQAEWVEFKGVWLTLKWHFFILPCERLLKSAIYVMCVHLEVAVINKIKWFFSI